MSLNVGIDKMSLYLPKHYIEMDILAQYRGIDPNKWKIGIGQDQMAVPGLGTDVVAMAANAARTILEGEEVSRIDQIIVGTESGVDYSKSIATYLHSLTGIPATARAYEIKQACYGATAGLLLACDYVRIRPDRKVLVIATDIAKYGLNTGGEVTQGAGALALLVSVNPKIMTLEETSYRYTKDIHDFWRPNHSEYAYVDGHYSTQMYQEAFLHTIKQAPKEKLDEVEALVFHLPFTKMGKKALEYYLAEGGPEDKIGEWLAHYPSSTGLNRRVGNIYTGSLYLSLLSFLLESQSLQAGQTIGLFSYGSGAVSELFFGRLVEGYQDHLNKNQVDSLLANRQALTPQEYESKFTESLSLVEGTSQVVQAEDTGIYFKGLVNYQRQYGLKES